MTVLKMSPVLVLLSSYLASYQTKNIQLQYSKFAHSLYYQLISEHFGENCIILLQTVAK